MPGPGVRNWPKYHRLRAKGLSPSAAARVVNAQHPHGAPPVCACGAAAEPSPDGQRWLCSNRECSWYGQNCGSRTPCN